MTPQQIESLPDYTDAQLLKLYRMALAQGWAGTTRTIGDQTTVFPGPTELLKLITLLETRVASAAGLLNDGVVLAVFGDVF